jgi:hypothetical protein
LNPGRDDNTPVGNSPRLADTKKTTSRGVGSRDNITTLEVKKSACENKYTVVKKREKNDN